MDVMLVVFTEFTTGSPARLFTRRIHTREFGEESRIIYTQIGLIFGLFNAHYVKWVLRIAATCISGRVRDRAGRHLLNSACVVSAGLFEHNY